MTWLDPPLSDNALPADEGLPTGKWTPGFVVVSVPGSGFVANLAIDHPPVVVIDVRRDVREWVSWNGHHSSRPHLFCCSGFHLSGFFIFSCLIFKQFRVRRKQSLSHSTRLPGACP